MSRPITSLACRTASALALTVLTATGVASAQNTIKGRDRPSYGIELEPHLTLGWISPPGIGTGEGIGFGARGTFEIVSEGFIKGVNDSVGIGVGLDLIWYDGDGTGPRGRCVQRRPGQNGGSICVEVEGSGDDDTAYLWVPVVMQWNFWLHKRWSVFGEPGFALRYDDMDEFGFSPFVLWGGGRYHISESAAVTLRAGLPFVITPYVSIGFSFLF
jgi:hypothetical protein